jgi:predicted O-methyltransferase YrrM
MLTLDAIADRVSALEMPRRYDPFSRRLQREELLELYQQWKPRLGLDWCEKSHIRYWQHRLVNVEQQCAGRMAGDVREAVLRIMVAAAAPGPDFRMLEIGTLFGVSAAATWDIAACLHDDAHVTIIDPLDGYYGPTRRDPATGLRVSRRTVERNLAQVGMPASAVRILQGLSQEETIITRAAMQTYNFMVIDGDHSYEGVRLDWEKYSPLLDAGGFAIFDNYEDPSWPEVARAVNEIAEDARFEFLGTGWRTAIIRRVAA